MLEQVKENWGVYPIFQHIFYGETELTENTLLLKDVGVLADDTVFVVCDEMTGGMEAAMNGANEDEITGDSADSVAGFGGTALFGLPAIIESSDHFVSEGHVESDASMQDLVMDPVEDLKLQCKRVAVFQYRVLEY